MNLNQIRVGKTVRDEYGTFYTIIDRQTKPFGRFKLQRLEDDIVINFQDWDASQFQVVKGGLNNETKILP